MRKRKAADPHKEIELSARLLEHINKVGETTMAVMALREARAPETIRNVLKLLELQGKIATRVDTRFKLQRPIIYCAIPTRNEDE